MMLGSDEWKSFVRRGAEVLGIRLDRKQLDQIAMHAVELQKWNRKINLTAVTDPREMAVKHVLDSMAPLPMIPESAWVLDIGSGGGFPGLPLKIAAPSLEITLIDGARKKVHFLKHVIRTLGLDHIEALHVRAEDFMLRTCGEKYDVVVCRALSSLQKIAQLALPLTKPGGAILAFKGKLQEGELAGLPEWTQPLTEPKSFRADEAEVSVRRYTLPFSSYERAVVSIRLQPASV